MAPTKEEIKRVVELYKQWNSEQCDQPLADYVVEHWEKKDYLKELLGYDPVEEFEQMVAKVYKEGGSL